MCGQPSCSFHCASRTPKIWIPLVLSLFAAGLSGCGTITLPHIGTVDTRHHAPGTVNAQASVGVGLVGILYPRAPTIGASIGADTHLKPNLSLALSGHAITEPVFSKLFMGSGRIGLRLRPTQKLSLGLGAFAGYSNVYDASFGTFGAGADIEVATSYLKPKERFVSYAWRLSLSHSTRSKISGTLVGDWSRSKPTRNKNIRLSYGVNYGVNLYSTGEESIPSTLPSATPVANFDFWYFVGGHIGLQWGGKLGKTRGRP